MISMNTKKQCLILLAFSLPLFSQGSENEKNYEHIGGVFAGVTHVDSDSDVTLGIEYELKVLDAFGFGMIYEHTPDAHSNEGASVYVLSGYLHPYQGWRLGFGLGQEKVHDDHAYT
jgi:hypothetical protein